MAFDGLSPAEIGRFKRVKTDIDENIMLSHGC